MQTLNLFPNIQNLGHNSAVPWDPRIWLSLTNADTEANPNNNLRQADLSRTILHRNIPGLRFLILPGPVFRFHCEYLILVGPGSILNIWCWKVARLACNSHKLSCTKLFPIWMQEIKTFHVGMIRWIFCRDAKFPFLFDRLYILYLQDTCLYAS